MKALIIISIFSLLAFGSCSNHHASEQTKKDTPVALDDKSLSSQIYSGSYRTPYDLVDDLYRELVDKNPELKQLEIRISDITRNEGDSAKSFNDYNSKNESYYLALDKHVFEIQDSTIRDKIRELIKADMAKYKASIVGHEDILHTIETKNVSMNDLHKVLKITKTIAVMNKYQKDNLPSTKPIEELLIQINQTIKLENSLIRK